MSTYKQPYGCIVQRESDSVERVIKQCDCCSAEFTIDLDAIESAHNTEVSIERGNAQ